VKNIMKTKAAVLYGAHQIFVIEELDLAEPSAGEILVQMKATGVCRTDEHIVEGSMQNPFPAVLGHEGAGIVRKVGPDVKTVKVGDHVICVWMPSCGTCGPCRNGDGEVCVRGAGLFDGGLLDGKPRFSKDGKDVYHYLNVSSFSEYIVIHEDSAIVVDKKAPFEKVCLLGCGITTGFGAVTKTANVSAGSTASIFGFGGIGAGALNGLVQSGADTIIVIDPNDWKEEIAMKMGATHFINPTKEDPVARTIELTNGVGVDYSFECFGSAEAQAQVYNSLRNKGTGIYIGAPDTSVNQLPVNVFSFCVTERIIKGSLYGSSVPKVEVPKFVSMFMHGKINLDLIVTRTFKLEEINQAFEAMRNGEVMRGVIVFE
jgi:S-(hydroxymethyl)glutathione dehydrogenase/alcohol dehydrogenase